MRSLLEKDRWNENERQTASLWNRRKIRLTLATPTMKEERKFK
jgi:hypothetical protein